MSGDFSTIPNHHHHVLSAKNCTKLLKDLLDIVRECQTKYGGKTELASEDDPKILQLCSVLEQAMCHGLRTNNSLLKNVADLVSGSPLNEPPTFWELACDNLTAHERERFTSFRHVWTDQGKGRALIRSALNERALERYILTWLADPNLQQKYEKYALLRDAEAVNLLPSIAAGLGSILFALAVDSPDLNVTTRTLECKQEPVIAVPVPLPISRRAAPVKRQIISFDEQQAKSLPSLSFLERRMEAERRSAAAVRREEISGVEEICNVSQEFIDRMKSASLTDVESSGVSNDFEIEDDSIRISEENSDLSGFIEEQRQRYPSIEMGSQDLSNNSSESSLPAAIPETENVSFLNKRLKEAEETCELLQKRVAELCLENYNLRALNNTSRYGLPYFTVSLPRVIMQRTTRKKYYAYEVHIIPTQGGDEWTVLRRYNDFYNMHRKVSHDNFSVKTLDFPPKRTFGNMDSFFVEQRRQRLQIYLRHLLAILPDVAACTTRSQLEHVFPFFK